MLHICPSEALLDMWEKVPKEFTITEEKDKPGCALCLLAIQQIYNAIENNRTEVLIRFIMFVMFIMIIFDYTIYLMQYNYYRLTLKLNWINYVIICHVI